MTETPTPTLLSERAGKPAASPYRGYCRACGKRNGLTSAGVLKEHDGFGRVTCSGSNEKPRRAMTWPVRARYAEKALDQITRAVQTNGHLTATELNTILAARWGAEG